MRAVVAGAGDRVDGEVAQAAMDAWAAKRLRTFEDAEQGLCFGRLDFEEIVAPPLHRPPLGARRRTPPARRQLAGAGRAAVLHGDAAGSPRRHPAPPVSHRRPAARRHRRRVARRLDRRRRRGRRLPARGARTRPRAAHARHRRDDPGRPVPPDHRRPAPPLVIQGGPGTGKTAVGLHRASYLLYSHRDTLARRGVLVVGPNRTFMEYVSHVLPALGESAVEQRAVGRARRRDRGDRARPAAGRGAQVGPAARRGDPPRGRAAAPLGAGRARRAARRLVRLGPRARGSRVPGSGTRGARPHGCRRASGSG